MEVPERMLNSTRRVSESSSVGLAAPVQAARILTPGAIKSGLRMFGVTGLGPRELKAASTGEGWTLTTVPWITIVAVGLGSVKT